MTQVLDFEVEPKDIIKQIIARRNISVRTLSNQIEIAEQNVSKMLSGNRTLTDTTLAKMAKALGIRFDLVKYGEGLDAYLSGLDTGTSHNESVQADQDGHHNKQQVHYKNGGDTQEDARQKLREAELKIQALERENELLKEINALLKGGKQS